MKTASLGDWLPITTPNAVTKARKVLRSVTSWKAQAQLLDRKIHRAAAQQKKPAVTTRWEPPIHRGMPEGAQQSIEKIMELMEQKQVLDRRIEAVEQALEDMQEYPMFADLLRKYYFLDMTAMQVAESMGYSERQFYRYLLRALALFAYSYGEDPILTAKGD